MNEQECKEKGALSFNHPRAITKRIVSSIPEFELVKQALYVDPYDQSSWIYHRCVLCDFGEARFILEEGYSEDIQPVQYRAPDVILGIPWNEKVDIWSVGVMVRIQHTMLDPDQSNATNRYGTCSRRSICFRSLVTQQTRMWSTSHGWLRYWARLL